MHQLSICDLKYCCLPRILQKQRNLVVSFVYKIDEILAIFSNLGDWCTAETLACLLPFSALRLWWPVTTKVSLEHFEWGVILASY